MKDRIYSHYRESIEVVGGDTKNKRWHQFFSHEKNLGELDIYYIEINEENDRQVIEKIIAGITKPTFELFKEKEWPLK